MMTNETEKLRLLAQILLTGENPAGLRVACHELYDLFCEIAGLDDSDQNLAVQNGTLLSTGKAISPVNAARCLWDFKRTYQFVRGIGAAALELKNRFPTERIEILYAGCGPFASLIVPLLDRFSPDEISLTLLDYHAASIASVKRLFEKLNFEKFNAVFIQTDASQYKHSRRIHLVICETMQNTLANETQTANTFNLAPQLCEGGIFLPEKISIEVCLANSGTENGAGKHIDLGRILELEAEKIRRNQALGFPPVQFKIPAQAKQPGLRFAILTKIRIFDCFRLDDYDSAITYPKFINDAPEIENADSIEFSYVIDQKPHFEYKIL
jgi:hypothetical protein